MISQDGNAQINIGKNIFNLKCTFAGLVEMENRACTGQGGLSYRIITKTAGINDITSIIYGGIVGKLAPEQSPPITFEELGEQVLSHGMDKLFEFCGDFLMYAMTGGRDNKPGKKKDKKD